MVSSEDVGPACPVVHRELETLVVAGSGEESLLLVLTYGFYCVVQYGAEGW